MANETLVESEIWIRKYKIVRFLSLLFLTSSLLAIGLILWTISNEDHGFVNHLDLIPLVISVLIGSMMAFIYFRGSRDNVVLSGLILVSLLVLVAYINAFIFGTQSPIVYMLVITAILTSSITISITSSRVIFFGSFIFLSIVFIYQKYSETNLGVASEDAFEYIDLLMLLFFTWIITNVARIGYDEIEHSYQKAVDYSKELEDLNKSLDDKVKLRTKQLEESLKRQADAVYSAAVVGSVTRPILHDISTPLSSFEMAVNQLEGADEEQRRVILNLAEISLKQMVEIVENGRDLIRGNVKESYFSPSELISVSLQILNNEINVNKIDLKVNVDQSHKIYGAANLYIRITTNLILNAIQELRDSGKENKVIEIKSKEENGQTIVCIKDSGRGISEEKIKTIFDVGFTSKVTNTNLGFGLPFVKSIIEDQFNGNIEIDSKQGKYTEFKMSFPQKNEKV